MKYVLNIFPESSAPGQHQQVGESSSVLKLKAQAKDTFEDNAQIVDGDTRKVISVGMWNEKLQDYKWQDAPKSQLVSDEILSNLCSYDERNPIGVYSYTSQEDVNDIKEPRDDCSCDSCFYGKDRLALEIIRLVTTLNPIGQLLSGKPDGADVLSLIHI